MAKVWYLDTETKGTGAHVAPLPQRGQERTSERELDLVTFRRPVADQGSAASPEDLTSSPLRFRVVDVMTSRVLGEDVDAARAVELLEGLRSIVDARVYARAPGASRWRLLGMDEQRVLWGFRGRPRRPAAASVAQAAA
jgi:hypothetical protein